MKTVKTLLLASAVFAFVVSLSACNTVEGLGEDLQESSQNVREAIEGD
ncbi:MAG: entericidin EcnAB [Planctomycetota bacterium]